MLNLNYSILEGNYVTHLPFFISVKWEQVLIQIIKIIANLYLVVQNR